MPSLSANAIPTITHRLFKKAKQSRSKIHISAIAFDKRGHFLAQTFNSFRDGLSTHKGGGDHAEMKLMKKYGGLIKTILLARVGHGSDFLPVHPCSACSSTARKLGISIVTIAECKEEEDQEDVEVY